MLYALAVKELRLLSRDIHGLAVLFLMPTVFILIMSLAMQNAFGGGRPLLTVMVAVDEAGPLGGRVIEQLRQNEAIRVVSASASHDFELFLPHGFSKRLLGSPDDPDQPLLSWSADPTVLPQARLAFRNAVIAALMRVQGNALISSIMPRLGANGARLREVTNPELWHIDVRLGTGAPLPSAVQQSVPGWLVFAMFFVVVPLSGVIVTEREQGTDLRLRALQLPAWQLLFSRLPPYFLLNMLQLAAALAVGVWLVPLTGGEALTLGAQPAGLLVVASATSLAAIGLALLVATVAKTSVQAFALGATLNLVFAALGGIMVPKMIMPEGMQNAAALSPMSWALEGFWDILLRGGSPVDALPNCAALSAFGLACMAVAAVLYHLEQSY
ncbi:MAG: ABC transporter permease [Nitrococcus sp.]|nr:ABC transporter permease [Nitrococcus sp.]